MHSGGVATQANARALLKEQHAWQAGWNLVDQPVKDSIVFIRNGRAVNDGAAERCRVRSRPHVENADAILEPIGEMSRLAIKPSGIPEGLKIERTKLPFREGKTIAFDIALAPPSSTYCCVSH